MNRYIPTRRAFLSSGATALLGASLTACTVVSGTTNTTTKVTTITVNVSKLAALVEAAKSVGDQIMALPGVTIPPATVLAINTAGSVLVADVLALNNATGGSATLTFDNSSVPAAITSLEKDLQSFQGVLVSAVGALNNSAINQYLATLSTTVLLFEGTIGGGIAPVPAT